MAVGSSHDSLLEQKGHNMSQFAAAPPGYELPGGFQDASAAAPLPYREAGSYTAGAMYDPTLPTQFAAGDNKHKSRLAISGIVLLVTGCFLPLSFYFVLKYAAHVNNTITLPVATAFFGFWSLFVLGQRCWLLGRPDSTVRPIGGGRWGFDYFHWNFVLGFVYTITVISNASSANPPSVRLAALSLTFIIIQVCTQMVAVEFLATNSSLVYPCRISSMARGSGPFRSALYTLIEDIVAVDGMQGTGWRISFNKRYETDSTFRQLLGSLSWYWGLSGLAVAVANLTLISVIKNEDIAWIIGWAVPWVWVALMAFPTYFWVTRSSAR